MASATFAIFSKFSRLASISRICQNVALKQSKCRSAAKVYSSRSFSTGPVWYAAGVVQKGEDPLAVSNAEWEKRLTSEQFYVAREAGTESPFTGEYVNNYDKGIYKCVCCGSDLFSSETKYDSGSGWPSFYAALGVEGGNESKTNVMRRSDNSHGMTRAEVICKRCDAHLGHVFPDGPEPTGERFCINSASLDFEEKS